MHTFARVLILGYASAVAAFIAKSSPHLSKTPGMLSAPRERPNIGKISAFVFSSAMHLRITKGTSTCPINRKTGLRSLRASTLVTYGDIWRHTLEELPTPPVDNQVNLTIDDKYVPEHPGVSITGMSENTQFEVLEQQNGSSLQAVVRPVRKAATVMGAVAAGAAANLWSSLTQGTSEDEVGCD